MGYCFRRDRRGVCRHFARRSSNGQPRRSKHGQSRRSRHGQSRTQPGSRRLVAERLEDRQMLSAAVPSPSERYGTDIHEYIAREAADLYGTLYGVAGIGLEYEAYLSGSICPAVVDEDDGLNSLNHFCEGGDGGELTDGLMFFNSAYTRASGTTYPDAVDYYHAAAKADAYYWLGHTMHLVQDMTLPAHVHNDQHALGDDQYEATVATYASSFDFAGADYWNFQEWNGDWSSSVSLWDRGDDYGTLEAIFRETVDYTDDYDSDDYPGDCHNSTSGDEFSSTRLALLDRAYHATWANSSVTGNGSELSAAEVQYLARDVGTWAVEQSAMLLRFFLDDMDQVVASPSGLGAAGTSPSRIRLDWADVAGADGYVVYRSTDSSTGFGYVATTASSEFENAGLPDATTYYYRVYAYNDVGGLGRGCSSASAATQPLLPGDADRNGTVNQADAAILAAHWGLTSMAWDDGDFNHDGRVNAADASILAANWGATTLGEAATGETATGGTAATQETPRQPLSSADPDASPQALLVGPAPRSAPTTARRRIRPAVEAGPIAIEATSIAAGSDTVRHADPGSRGGGRAGRPVRRPTSL